MSANRLTTPINTTNVSARFAAARGVCCFAVIINGRPVRRSCCEKPGQGRPSWNSRAKTAGKLHRCPDVQRSWTIAPKNPELRRQDRVEHLQVFLAHAREHLAGGLARHHEIHAHGFLSREFQKVRFVGDTVAAVARDGTECGAARKAKFLRLRQQPVVQQHAAVAAVFVHEEAQVHALDGCGVVHAKCLNTLCISAKPKSVIPSVPITCTPMIAKVQPYWPRSSRVTVSPEKVEKVVRPPRKPVVTNTRVSGDSDWNCANAPRIKDRKSTRLNSSHPS